MFYLIWRLQAAACEVELKLGRVKLFGQASKQHKADKNLSLSDSCVCAFNLYAMIALTTEGDAAGDLVR